MRLRASMVAASAVALVLAPAAGAQGVDTTCQFSLTRLDSTTTNALAVDTNATYWGGAYASLPGLRIRIEGQFPFARYMSWNLYDTRLRPIDALTDEQIQPDPGSENPFIAGADRLGEERDYTAFIEFGAPPEDPDDRAPNTLYTGDSRSGSFLYRVYIPDRDRDAKGGVPLPRVTLESADGEGGSPGVDLCRDAQAPFVGPINEAIASSPGIPELTGDGEGYPGRSPPNWRLFVNFPRAAIDIMFDAETTGEHYDRAKESPFYQDDGAGFFANRDIAYVFTGTSRGFGEVLVLTGKAPTFADTRDGPSEMPEGHQLRYWSFCQYETATQRVIDCRSDDRVKVARDGTYTIVVSAADHRPENARSRCDVSWIAWGPTTHGLLIYRHMLADPDFRRAIQRVEEPGEERETMRRYYPTGEYLASKEAFEARGCKGAPKDDDGDDNAEGPLADLPTGDEVTGTIESAVEDLLP